MNSEIVDFDKNCQRQIQSVIRAKKIQNLGSESQSRVEKIIMASAWDIFNAAKEGDEALQKILKNSANNIDVKGSYGKTALHDATRSGNVKALELLLQKQAKVNEKSKNGAIHDKKIIIMSNTL